MDILSCPVLSSPPPKRKRENDTGSPLFFPVVLGGGVTGYLSRASNGVIKQSMAGSKGRVFLLLGSFFFFFFSVSPIVCPIKEDPIVGKSRILFLLFSFAV